MHTTIIRIMRIASRMAKIMVKTLVTGAEVDFRELFVPLLVCLKKLIVHPLDPSFFSRIRLLAKILCDDQFPCAFLRCIIIRYIYFLLMIPVNLHYIDCTNTVATCIHINRIIRWNRYRLFSCCCGGR